MIIRFSALVFALFAAVSCGKRAPLDVPPPPENSAVASAAQ
ncbi:MAG: hypothetical protein AAFX52_10255 [Pseudomonadota bacterium]